MHLYLTKSYRYTTRPHRIVVVEAIKRREVCLGGVRHTGEVGDQRARIAHIEVVEVLLKGDGVGLPGREVRERGPGRHPPTYVVRRVAAHGVSRAADVVGLAVALALQRTPHANMRVRGPCHGGQHEYRHVFHGERESGLVWSGLIRVVSALLLMRAESKVVHGAARDE